MSRLRPRTPGRRSGSSSAMTGRTYSQPEPDSEKRASGPPRRRSAKIGCSPPALFHHQEKPGAPAKCKKLQTLASWPARWRSKNAHGRSWTSPHGQWTSAFCNYTFACEITDWDTRRRPTTRIDPGAILTATNITILDRCEVPQIFQYLTLILL